MVIRFGPFALDLAAGELRKDGIRLRLQDKPLRVLEALIDRPGSLVTREELRKRLWSDDTFVDFDNSLNNAINRLRAALDDDAGSPRFVETVGRRGYRFLAQASTDAGPATRKPQRGLRGHGWWCCRSGFFGPTRIRTFSRRVCRTPSRRRSRVFESLLVRSTSPRRGSCRRRRISAPSPRRST
jgi:DNA-binding winged helix-turn-helix (wHTH) protein